MLRALCLLVSLLPACAGVPHTEKPKAAGERLYQEGMRYLRQGALLEAQQTFQEVLKLPAYLRVTSLARLRLGDTLFHQSKYDLAAEQYDGYARRHEGSPNVPYARFMAARSQFRLIPDEIWLLPPIEEMDLSAAEKARYHLERFIRSFPLSRYVPKAQKLRERAIALLLAQHRYVVRFYVTREQWIGAAFRLHELMRRFPMRGHTVGTYAQLVAAYTHLGWRSRALAVARELALRWPGSPEAAVALHQITELRADIARRKARGDKDAEMPLDTPPTAKAHPEKQKEELLGEG